MTIEYDGSFEGFLGAAADALARGDSHPAFSVAGRSQPLLFEETRPVARDPAAADALLDRLARRASPEAARTLALAFLTERPGIEDALFAYLTLALTHGPDVDRLHAHKAVHAVHRLARRTSGETHRFKGLLRFRELRDGVLWAPFDPDCNILFPVALHFTRRLAAETWVIHDVRRNLAAAWDGQALSPAEPDPATWPGHRPANSAGSPAPPLSEAEQEVATLWRDYCRTIAIPERRNTTLQARNMPRRYWRFLVEKEPRSARA